MSKEEEQRLSQVRRRNILYLIQRYLNENGLQETSESLRAEARLISEYELCDNIDLDSIYLEYLSYYQVKFGKYPRILKKSVASATVPSNVKHKKASPKLQHKKKADETKADSQTLERTLGDSLHIKEIKTEHKIFNKSCLPVDSDNGFVGNEGIMFSSEWMELAEVIKSTIMQEDFRLKWADICGNCKAVEIIKEAVLLPLNSPFLFQNGLKPWKSLLLHGPPGSGKTFLAKVLYSETRGLISFFNITSSSVISKWRGESEKILKVLFHLAKKYAPSVIFIDEIEGLTSKRDRTSDHESSKRFKNEFLQLMDGMENNGEGIFILATTNLPWDIDAAFIRRFEKKILVQLPDREERQRLIEKMLPAHMKWPNGQIQSFSDMCKEFTGDEIRLGCKESAMKQIRNLASSKETNVMEITKSDLQAAFEKIKPIGARIMQKHINWNNECGT